MDWHKVDLRDDWFVWVRENSNFYSPFVVDSFAKSGGPFEPSLLIMVDGSVFLF